MAHALNKLVWLHFNEPRPDGKQDYFFTSAKVMYTYFSREELGVAYNYMRKLGLPYSNSICSVTRHVLLPKNKEQNDVSK